MKFPDEIYDLLAVLLSMENKMNFIAETIQK